VLEDFCSKGGLHGMIGEESITHGLSPRDYLTGP
jgi:hypothetical protein